MIPSVQAQIELTGGMLLGLPEALAAADSSGLRGRDLWPHHSEELDLIFADVYDLVLEYWRGGGPMEPAALQKMLQEEGVLCQEVDSDYSGRALYPVSYAAVIQLFEGVTGTCAEHFARCVRCIRGEESWMDGEDIPDIGIDFWEAMEECADNSGWAREDDLRAHLLQYSDTVFSTWLKLKARDGAYERDARGWRLATKEMDRAA